MPEPITAASPAGHTIDLEPVVVTGSLSKPEAQPHIPIGEFARECFSEGNAVAVALLTKAVTNPVVGPVAGVGVGYALSKCITNTIDRHAAEDSDRRAIDRCVAAGGTPIALIRHVLTCQVRE
jgi:hypothetical protein